MNRFNNILVNVPEEGINAPFSHFIFDPQVKRVNIVKFAESFPCKNMPESIQEDQLSGRGNGDGVLRDTESQSPAEGEPIYQVVESFPGALDLLQQMLTPDTLFITGRTFDSVDDEQPDVIIKFNYHRDCPYLQIVDIISSSFSNHGYKVEIDDNCPDVFAPSLPYSFPALLIEVNMDVLIHWYGMFNIKRITINQIINQIYCRLLKKEEENPGVKRRKNSLPADGNSFVMGGDRQSTDIERLLMNRPKKASPAYIYDILATWGKDGFVVATCKNGKELQDIIIEKGYRYLPFFKRGYKKFSSYFLIFADKERNADLASIKEELEPYTFPVSFNNPYLGIS